MRASRLIAAFLFALAASPMAAEKYAGPDDAATLAGARAALPKAQILNLGKSNVLDLETSRVLDIVGVTRGIDGVLKDLGAKVTAQEIRIELSADVLFDFDKHDLRPEAVPSLQKVAEVLRSRAGSPV